eukprot:15485765-Alexandrium_andersonii.AAC.1
MCKSAANTRKLPPAASSSFWQFPALLFEESLPTPRAPAAQRLPARCQRRLLGGPTGWQTARRGAQETAG